MQVGLDLLRCKQQNVARIYEFLSANILTSSSFPTIISVRIDRFRVSECVHVFFRVQNAVFGDISRCVQYGCQTHTDVGFSDAFARRCRWVT